METNISCGFNKIIREKIAAYRREEHQLKQRLSALPAISGTDLNPAKCTSRDLTIFCSDGNRLLRVGSGIVQNGAGRSIFPDRGQRAAKIRRLSEYGTALVCPEPGQCPVCRRNYQTGAAAFGEVSCYEASPFGNVRELC